MTSHESVAGADVIADARASSLWPLFIASVAALYIEIMLIRWISTEFRIFAYFQNLALIACFLGFGIGCYRSQKPQGALRSMRAIAAAALLLYFPMADWQQRLIVLSNSLSISKDAALWGMQGLSTWEMLKLYVVALIMLIAVLLALIQIMVPLGQWVGNCLDRSSDVVKAYSVNLIGSLIGLWLLAALAFTWLSPLWWIVVAFALLLLVQRPPRKTIITAVVLLCIIATLIKVSERTETHWSPYQKLTVSSQGDGEYEVFVNNTGYMTITNLSPEFRATHPNVEANYQDSSYDSPFRFIKNTGRVLIVGGGAGNDAAAALRHGASRVDVVEIDPLIYSIGKRHPEKPYSSPLVHPIITDARHYMRGCKEQYDVIVFGLLDSHTQFSGYSNMRVDNYVYTEESFREARDLLKPSGVLVLKFEVREPWTWMGQRHYATLSKVFGRPPVAFYAPTLSRAVSASEFLESKDDHFFAEAASNPEFVQFLATHPPGFRLDAKSAPPLTSDDWPYIYHFDHSIPRTYKTVAIILLALALVFVSRLVNVKEPSTWQMFLLGGGFLLTETQMVSRMALYFGTTWIVNSIVISAVLAVLVLANVWVEKHSPEKLGGYYAVLVFGLVGNYLIPWERISLGTTTIGLLLIVAYSVPVFCAGIIFTQSFRACRQKSSAFGANILGAVAGGLTQNLSFIFGLKALLLFSAAFYIGAAAASMVGSRLGPVQVRRAAAGS